MPTEQIDDHAEVLRLIAGQLTAHPDPDLHDKLSHFAEHGRLPDAEPVEAEAVEVPEVAPVPEEVEVEGS